MEMTVTPKPEATAILRLKGVLDGSTAQALIDEAQKLYAGGTRNLLIDLGGLTFMSSAGISALFRVALIFRGEKIVDEKGWASYRAIGRERGSNVQQHVRLLNPAERVKNALELVGFTTFFEIHTDEAAALAAFK